MQGLFDRAFIEPFHRLAEQLRQVLPGVMTVVVILVAGSILAYLVRQAAYGLLRLIHFDKLAARTGWSDVVERTRVFRSASDFGARVAQGAVWLLIILFALSAIGSPLTEDLVLRFFRFVPDLLTAILVLLLGSVISKFLARSTLLAAVNAQWAAARLLSGGVRIFVMSLAVVIALEQIRIGRTALLASFAILFAGIVMAAAISFGLAGRELAREWFERRMRTREPQEEEVLRHL